MKGMMPLILMCREINKADRLFRLIEFARNEGKNENLQNCVYPG